MKNEFTIQNSKLFQFLYYTNCINLSICFLSVWRKKIRSTLVNLNFKCPLWEKIETHLFLKSECKGTAFF